MRLSEFLAAGGATRTDRGGDPEILGIACDSREVEPGFLFAVIPGNSADGARYIDDAAERGAAALLAAEPPADARGLPCVVAEDVRKSLGEFADIFHNHPSRSLDLVGVTGTNGKTTTAYLLRHIFNAAGRKCGMLGTVEYDTGGRAVPAPLTTPDAVRFTRALAEMRDNGCSVAAVEVSSHALAQRRVWPHRFAGALFTNLTRDHLDYHRDMERYGEAKRSLFLGLDADAFGVFNMADPAGAHMAAAVCGRVLPYRLEDGDIAESTLDGQRFRARDCGFDREFLTPLVGRYNVENCLGAILCARHMGVATDVIAEAIANFPGVPGRMERIDSARGVRAFVDYSHTDDSLRSALSVLRPLVKGRLIVVFGCGGGRDAGKRPLMARAAERGADLVIVTSDNPRTEDPEAIIDEIMTGFAKPEKVIRPRTGERGSAMKITLSEIAGWCGGRLEPADAGDVAALGVSTDTRTIAGGELFVAINGLNLDGHRFIRFAAQAGAAAVVAEQSTQDTARLPTIFVDDTLDALGRIANGYRWRAPLIPWVAVTGSNGKTTTRELLSLILGSRWKVRVSKRNWNNFVGLPLSMLGAPDDAGAAVMEMGTSRPGEIAKLREICVPTIGIVTSTGESHLEGFGNSRAVAREKADIFGWLPPDGLAVYPAGDPNADILRSAVVHRSATFSLTPEIQADAVARDIEITASGSLFTVDGVGVFLPLPGRHNIGNCLAAMLAARHLGIDYPEAARALQKAKPVAGRLQATKTHAKITVINDSYNANPNSVLAGLEVLAELPEGRKIAVLGDMLELGPESRRWHREVGLSVGMMDLDALFAVGPESAAMAEAAQVNARIVVRHFSSVQALWDGLRVFLRAGDQVLVKGSRGMQMERVVTQLLDWFPNT